MKTKHFALFIAVACLVITLAQKAQTYTAADVPDKLTGVSPSDDQKAGLVKAVNAYNSGRTNNFLTPDEYFLARQNDVLNSYAQSVVVDREAAIAAKFRAADSAKKAAIESAVDDASK